MYTNSDEKACVFSKIITATLEDNLTFVTVHLIVRDNHNRFFFVKNEPSISESLKYKVIDFDTIFLTDYPLDLTSETLKIPGVIFYFSTDKDPTTEYKNFELFIQFVTKGAEFKKPALKFYGKRSTSVEGPSNEDETERGVVYFPDVGPD